ncbi:MAG TPA: hypothetical protein VGT41_04520 [Candidatus Babeliales bacterium]|nr:hypothetical protein [Candidatus Babeliales bacterium]
MLKGIKVVSNYSIAVLRVFFIFLMSLFFPWLFLYHVQLNVIDNKPTMYSVCNENNNSPTGLEKEKMILV